MIRYDIMFINIYVCVIFFFVFVGIQVYNVECFKMFIKCDFCGKKKIFRDKVFFYLVL